MNHLFLNETALVLLYNYFQPYLVCIKGKNIQCVCVSISVYESCLLSHMNIEIQHLL